MTSALAEVLSGHKRYNSRMKRLLLVVASTVIVLGAGAGTFVLLDTLNKQQATRQVESVPDTPDLRAETVVNGLDHPWDIDFLPDDTLLVTERSGLLSRVVDGTKTELESPNDVDANGEGGLMGLAVDPEFAQNQYVYACLNSTRGDVRVARWKLADMVLSERTDIVTGIPAAESGRHSGCQIAFGPDDNLWIGTGDAADETQPQDQRKLGGKILRVDREGKAAINNPDGPDTRVYSYGHRNTQALVFFPTLKDTSYGYSVEHGPDRDDEINDLKPGNFGWNPGDGYDESVPMTDTDTFADANVSVWSSGSPTIAPSGAALLKGRDWGRLDGWLAVSVLKGQKLLVLNISNGSVAGERSYFANEHGRLRAATLGPDGALYVSTDNGSNDSILRITTAAR